MALLRLTVTRCLPGLFMRCLAMLMELLASLERAQTLGHLANPPLRGRMHPGSPEQQDDSRAGWIVGIWLQRVLRETLSYRLRSQ